MTGWKVFGDGETFKLTKYEFDLKYLGCTFPPHKKKKFSISFPKKS